jgi:exopolysaccharide biosynthesis polyprenyl glycosylphosphotransferase
MILGHGIAPSRDSGGSPRVSISRAGVVSRAQPSTGGNQTYLKLPMTPPPAASHVAPARALALRASSHELVAGAMVRVLDVRNWSRLRALVDVVVLYLAASAALLAAPVPGDAVSRWLAATFPLLALAIIHARRSPDERPQASKLDTAAHVVGGISLAAVLTIAADSTLGGAHGVGPALRLWLFASVYLGIARVVLLLVRRQAICNEALATPTLVIGAGLVGERLVERLVAEPKYGMRPVGFLDADPPARSDPSRAPLVPLLGAPNDLADAVARTGARHVILAFSSEPDQRLVERVEQCQRLGLEVSLIPRLYESINERATLDHVGGLPLVSLRPTDPRGWQFTVKHAFDRAFALVALLALAPVMIAIAIGVRASSSGPALFRQRRVGRDGRVFDVLKFRTMLESNGAHEFELPYGSAPGGVEGIDRRTGVGKWLRGTSLDELPQLLNVLRGDMSLVGPRPERPEFVERFNSEVNRYGDRHRVKSGITGWAQVNGLRGQTSIADRVEWDNYYIQNWSLRLDLRILALTVWEVLRAGGR